MGAQRIAMAALTLGAATACSLLLSTAEDQCATDDDCAKRGAAFAGSRCVSTVCVPAADAATDAADADASNVRGPDFACLGNHPAPKPASPTARLTEYFHDFLVDKRPITSVSVRVCPNAADPTCAGVAITKKPDSTGHVTFDLDVSQGPFTGYLAVDPILPDGGSALVDAGDIADTYMPARIYFASIPVAADLSDDWNLPTYGTFETFLQLYGLPPRDPKLGVAFVVMYDCAGKPAAGVSSVVDSVSSSTLSFYFVENAPVLTASSTDGSGYVGFVNLPTGARTWTAKVAANQRPFGSLTMYALPGVISFANFGPEFLP